MENPELTGLLYSCGSVKSKNIIEIQTKRKELAELICNMTTLADIKTNSRGYSVQVTGKNLIKNFGIDKTQIPDLEDKKKRTDFLRGFFEGKSSISIITRIIRISGKKEQLEKIKKLLNFENVDSVIYPTGNYYSLYIEGKNRCEVFRDKIGFLTREKKDKLDKLISFGI
ncbi:MAG: hypothetical protein DRP06_02995 [Candidatus Aenigmatarchaeota archaeon]|nr:MAG: hypothetical protein DRP06_02995 [Candidatus Aenigmarchaeota archaeon]